MSTGRYLYQYWNGKDMPETEEDDEDSDSDDDYSDDEEDDEDEIDNGGMHAVSSKNTVPYLNVSCD